MRLLALLLALPCLLAAQAAQSVAQEGYPLRDGCEESDSVVEKLPAGSPVDIRFAIASSGGTCYKVNVTVQGRTVQGWVHASGLTSTEAFDQARRDARSIDLPRMAENQVSAFSKKMSAAPQSGPIGEAIRLLDDKQPSQALRILESALQIHSRDPQLLALAGVAAYRADETRRAVDFMKASLAIEPNASLEQFASRLETELKSDTGGQRMYGTRFVLRYDGASVESARARATVETLEQEYTRIASQLGCRMEERMTAIIQTPEAYRRTTNSAEWSGGEYDGAKIRVALFEPDPAGPITRQIFAHELVHACLASLGQFPTWLHEGLAQKLSGSALPRAEAEAIRVQVRSHALSKLEELPQDWSHMDVSRAQMNYRYAHYAVQILFEKFAGYGIQNVLRNPGLLTQVTAEIDRKIAE